MKIPCESCILYARCINKTIVECTILFKKFVELDEERQVTNIKVERLQRTAQFLGHHDWTIMERKKSVTIYTMRRW